MQNSTSIFQILALDPLLQLTAALILSALFTTTALHKWRQPLHFEGVLGQYKLLPRRVVPLSAKLLPLLEAALALALVFNISRQAAGVFACFLLLSYTAAIGINLKRGRVDIDCGCGESATHLSRTLLWRNTMLILLAIITALPSTSRPWGMLDICIALIATLAFSLSYISWNQLIANHSYKKRVWK